VAGLYGYGVKFKMTTVVFKMTTAVFKMTTAVFKMTTAVFGLIKLSMQLRNFYLHQRL
jgi:hypothetical protein